MLIVAFKMLVNSRKKFIGMVIGASFSAFIIMQQPSIYQGITDRIVAPIQAIVEPDLWVMDKNSSMFDRPTHFNSMDIYRIRSVPGILWATQLYRIWYPMRHLKTNTVVSWELVGVDPEMLIGLPKKMIAGARSTIRQSNSVIIDGYSLDLLETKEKATIKKDDQMAEGQNTWVITGVTQPLRTYSYFPKAYMASNHIPNILLRDSFILVKVKPSFDVHQVANNIHKITQYDALTQQQFINRSKNYFRKQTPILIIFIVIGIIGFTIGLIMMWQIFSNFILTHLHQFGMLKMLGVPNSLLIKMVLFQAAITGGAGYIIGLLLNILFGKLTNDTVIAFHLTGDVVWQGALGTAIIIIMSSYFCILNVIRLDTVDLCRDLN